MSGLDFVTCTTIIVACFLIGFLCKKVEKIKDNYIPVIVVISGMILGIAAHCIGMADMPSTDIITSAIIGAWSGFVSTGVDQMFKQIKKLNKEGDDDECV